MDYAAYDAVFRIMEGYAISYADLKGVVGSEPAACYCLNIVRFDLSV